MLRRYYLLEGLNALGTNVFFLGVFFHARVEHGYSDAANLMLAAAQGAAYVLATRAGGRFADRVGAERSIALGVAGMCLSLLAGWRLPHAAALFATIALYSASTALTWPALEAAIARAPGRVALARRAGLYNVIWSVTGATGFFFSGSLFARDTNAVFLVPLAAHALMLALLAASAVPWLFPRTGGVMTGTPKASSRDRLQRETGCGRFSSQRRGGAKRGTPTGRTEGSTEGVRSDRTPKRTPGRGRATCSRPASPTASATSSSGPSPPSPPRSASASASVRNRGCGSSAPTSSRAARSSCSSGAGTAGSTAAAGSWRRWRCPRPPLQRPSSRPAPRPSSGALALLGALSGVAYSASLHASLDREGGEGEGGGLHEWVIGLGVLLGPLAGAAGAGLFGGPAGAGGLVTALGAAAAVAGLAPLLRERAGA